MVKDNVGYNTPKNGFEIHVQVNGWGNDNRFESNDMTVARGRDGVNIQSKAKNNFVSCNNVVKGENTRISNIGCK